MEEMTSMQEAYLEKTRKTRKITFSLILALVLAIAIIVTTFACVKVDIRPKFVTAPDQVAIYRDGKSNLNFDSSTDIYKDFDEIYNKMFNISYLSAIFSGRLGGYKIVENAGNNGQIMNWYTNSNETTMNSELASALGSNYVKLHFDEEKRLKNSDGSEYVSINNLSYVLTYHDIYFAISEENVIQDFTFYIAVKGNNDKRTTVSKITLSANTSSLYEEFVK